MAATKWNSLGLCAGVGLLDVAVQLGCEHLGIDCRPAALCEWDAYAAGVLLSRMEETSLEPCPIWCGDLRDFDARPFRGVVDVLAAGLPCQPYSVAGKQLGNSDHRSHGDDGSGPIPQFLRIVAECRPAVVFCENVPPWVRGGWFRPVGEELSRLGYTIEDPLFITAEAVGASHKRERVFVLAHHPSARGRLLEGSYGRTAIASTCEVRSGRVREQQRSAVDEQSELCDAELAVTAERGRGELRQSSERDGFADWGDEVMGHAEQPPSDARSARSGQREAVGEPGEPVEQSHGSGRRLYESGRGSDRRAAAGRTGEAMADALRTERESGTGRRGVWEDGAELDNAGTERSGSIFAPGPDADWRDVAAHLWPAIESGVRLLVDGCPVVVDASRADQLRCAGNAVVPLQAAVAFVELMRRAVKEMM